MRWLLSLLLFFSMLAMSISQAQTVSKSDLVFTKVTEKAASAIKFCGQFGPAPCNEKLTEATDQIVASFELEKPSIAGLSCSSPEWESPTIKYMTVVKGFGEGISSMMEYTAKYAGTADLSRSAASGYIKDFSLTFERLLRFGAEVYLYMGDQALRSGCREEADKNYRSVLKYFPSEQMVSYRERAQVGISDVRNSRGILCRTVGYC